MASQPLKVNQNILNMQHQTKPIQMHKSKKLYYVSPNMDNMKNKYREEDLNESEAENDSHKSNSKRKQKRVFG